MTVVHKGSNRYITQYSMVVNLLPYIQYSMFTILYMSLKIGWIHFTIQIIVVWPPSVRTNWRTTSPHGSDKGQ